MKERKLRVGFISNSPVGGKTGLYRNSNALLPLLYKSNKYDLFFLAQGASDNDPSFQKLPFPCFGVFKNFDQNRFNSDDGYKRFVAYGNTAVEEFVISNKLDVLVHSDDIWSSSIDAYIRQDWYNNIKQNFVQHTTCDSLPILPDFKEWAKNCPNMWFWTSFAEKALKEENYELYKHCKTMHGAININNFRPLPKQEILDLRHKFGIKDDEKIFIYLSRNQLRKVGFWANIEALAKFKKKHPNKKVKLLYHCFISEPGGWPIDRIREENALNKEDIFTTYYCRNCNDWNVQNYLGEELDCPVCKSQKSRITAGISSSINEADLNKIYNLADASTSYNTSAGLEYCNVESLLAGLPLSTTPYAGTSEFTSQEFVHSIRGTFTREVGTSFKKHVPDIDSIVEYFEYIYDLPESKRQEITEKGRKWAIEQFDAKNIVKKYEEFLDKCKPIDWDSFLKKKTELKNVNAQVENLQDDKDFIINSYKKILNMDVDENESGYQHWLKFLSQPQDRNKLRNEMINAFRNAAATHNAKIQPQIPFDSLLDKSDKSRVLLILKESIGDLYILSSLLPEIQLKYPDSTIYIGCDQKYFELFDNSPIKVKLIPWSQEQENEMLMVGIGGNKKFFDHFINIGLTTQRSLNYLSAKY